MNFFSILLLIFPLVSTGSVNCPSSNIPEQLVSVSVWSRQYNSSKVYRISDEDLTNEGYQRSTDRNMVVMFAKDAGQCSIGSCAVRLSTGRRNNGEISLIEDAFTVPVEDMNTVYICARHLGDCGADLPVFRFTRGNGGNISYAYSLDPAVTFPEYTRDPEVLCYGWINGSSVVHPLSSEQQCGRLQEIANAKVTYSSTGSSSFSVGTTATLSCDEGYKGGGQSTVLCTRSGWYPSNGLGFCVEQSSKLITQSTVSSIDEMCSVAPNVTNGDIVYSQIVRKGHLPFQTKATIICKLGYVIYGNAEIWCSKGKWSEMPTCHEVTSVKCPPLLSPLGGKLSYSPTSSPYTLGASVSLTCDPGLDVSGLPSLICGADGWKGQIGVCKSPRRSKRQVGVSCPVLNVLTGRISYVQANVNVLYSTGTSAYLTCNTGYTLQGSSSSLCQNGAWNPPIGTCTFSIGTGVTMGGSCPDVSQPANGIITYSATSTHTSGSTVTLMCNFGYTVSGSLSSTCSNGMWTPLLGTCMQGLGTSSTLECPNPLISNGIITYSLSSANEATKPVGTTATLICNAGFSTSGPSISTCFSGAWSPVLSSCVYNSTGSNNQQCFAIYGPFGATITYSTGSSFGPFNGGTTATITCPTSSSGGAFVSTCVNGQWQPAAPTSCSSIGGTGSQSCSSMIVPFGMTLVYSSGILGSYSSGTVVRASCMNGGTIQGVSSATCINGQWSPMTLGTCGTQIGGSQTCPTITQLSNGRIDYSDGSMVSTHQSGATASLVCTTGMPLGFSASTCVNGQWSPTLGSCSFTSTNGSGQQCIFGASMPFGGTVTYSNGVNFGPWPEGTSVTLSCPLGQYTQGSSIAYCTNGMWSNLGTCGTSPGLGGCNCTITPGIIPLTNGTINTSSANGCNPLIPVSTVVGNGYALYTPNIEVTIVTGTVFSIYCYPGFVLYGNSQLTCTANGWQPPVPGQCISQGGGSGSSCPYLSFPTNGQITFSQGGAFGPFPTGATAMVSCNLGFTISGASSAQCQNGMWVPPSLGTCISGINEGSGIGSQCTAGLPSTISGLITYSNNQPFGPWPAGTTASLTCNAGYITSGSSSSVCQFGSWMPSTLGQCIFSQFGGVGGQQCQAVPFVSRGTVSYSQLSLPPYAEGTRATLFCNLGTTLLGQQTVTCQGGTWVPFPGLGICQGTLVRDRAALDDYQNGNSSVHLNASCSVPKAPPFGEVTFSSTSDEIGFKEGITAALRCKQGYSIIGASFSTCRSGSFRPLLGKCSDGNNSPIPGVCTPLSPPLNGRITYIQSNQTVHFEKGTTALLYCEHSFSVTGQATLTCSEDGWVPNNGFGQCIQSIE